MKEDFTLYSEEMKIMMIPFRKNVVHKIHNLRSFTACKTVKSDDMMQLVLVRWIYYFYNPLPFHLLIMQFPIFQLFIFFAVNAIQHFHLWR